MVEHHLNFPHCYFYSAAFILIDFITDKMRRINSKTKSKTLKTVKYKPFLCYKIPPIKTEIIIYAHCRICKNY